jgi:hypothetical protein
MSTLVDRTGRPPMPDRRPATSGRPRPPVGRAQLAAGALAAVQAATASLVVILIPVVLAWATASYSRAPWGQAVQVGVGAWLLAHHTGIVIPGGHLGLAPLGLTLIPLISCWLAGVRLARNLDPNAEAIRAGVGRARPKPPPPRALMALVLSYTSLVTLIAALTASASVRPLIPQAFVGSAVICGLASVCGAAAWVRGGFVRGLRRVIIRMRLPGPVRRSLRPAALALAVHLGGATLILLTAFVLGRDRVLLLHHALAPGIAGGLVLSVAQLMLLPNLVIWAGAWAAGSGFAVGTGTSVQPGHTELGALPAVPILGALPTPGTAPAWAWAVLALPVLAGGLAGWWLLRADPDAWVDPGPAGSPTPLLIETGLTAVVTGATWTVLGWLAGGPGGPGRLAHLGPSAWQLGLAVLVEIAVGAFAVVGIGLLVRLFSPRPPVVLDLESPLLG